MINYEITSWTQPVGSEIKGDKHGDSDERLVGWCLTSSEQFFSYIQDENI